MDATVSVAQIELGATPAARALAFTSAVIRGQAYWLVWLLVVALDLYSARQTEYAPWLWSHYSWWVAPFVLLITMPRGVNWPNAGLPALLVFAWLGRCLLDTTQYALIDWFPIDAVIPIPAFRFPVQDLLSGIVVALGLTHATYRVFGPRAIQAALIAGFAAGLSLHEYALTDWPRWINRPLSMQIHLFGASIFALIYAAGAQRLHLAHGREMWKLRPRAAALLKQTKARVIGFPSIVMCALFVLLITALISDRLEASAQWRDWILNASVGLVILASVSWAARRALERAQRDMCSSSPSVRIAAAARMFGIWATLLAFWLPMAFSSWKAQGDKLEELVQAMAGPAWKLSVSDDGETLHYTGEIVDGSATALQTALTENPRARVLDLDSFGGLIYEAEAMADLDRERRLDTLVRDECLSACTIVFAGGRERALGEDGALGYHDENVYGLPSGRTLDEKMTVENESAIDRGFLIRTFSVPHWDMWYPKEEELVAAGVVTKVVEKDGGLD